MYGLPPAPPARTKRARTVLIAGTAFLVGVGATFAGVEYASRSDTRPAPRTTRAAATPSPTTVAMSGHITMLRYEKDADPQFRIANWTSNASDRCEGRGGFGDMREGADVTVYGADGQVIGASSLEGGQQIAGRCSWAFTVEGLPVEAFYQVEVSHRGKVTVQRADVGFAELTLGG